MASPFPERCMLRSSLARRFPWEIRTEERPRSRSCRVVVITVSGCELACLVKRREPRARVAAMDDSVSRPSPQKRPFVVVEVCRRARSELGSSIPECPHWKTDLPHEHAVQQRVHAASRRRARRSRAQRAQIYQLQQGFPHSIDAGCSRRLSRNTPGPMLWSTRASSTAKSCCTCDGPQEIGAGCEAEVAYH